MADILPFTPESVHRACKLLRGEQCVVMPTETVYGLAGNGLCDRSVARIFEIKQRPSFDPLILHIPEGFGLSDICNPTETARVLMEAFWPGPLTVLLEKKACVPDLVTSGLPTVAVRCPAHPVAQELLRSFGGPLAAPSANRFGRISPTTAQAALEELGDRLEVILEGGPCEKGLESTIVNGTGSTPTILRKGAIPIETIREIFPDVSHDKPHHEVIAPGQLDSHYAPSTPLYRTDRPLAEFALLPDSCAYLLWSGKGMKTMPSTYRILSDQGDAKEAASRLFQALRELDHEGKPIFCEPVPSHAEGIGGLGGVEKSGGLGGLGEAIQDRLNRASGGIRNPGEL